MQINHNMKLMEFRSQRKAHVSTEARIDCLPKENEMRIFHFFRKVPCTK